MTSSASVVAGSLLNVRSETEIYQVQKAVVLYCIQMQTSKSRLLDYHSNLYAFRCASSSSLNQYILEMWRNPVTIKENVEQ